MNRAESYLECEAGSLPLVWSGPGGQAYRTHWPDKYGRSIVRFLVCLSRAILVKGSSSDEEPEEASPWVWTDSIVGVMELTGGLEASEPILLDGPLTSYAKMRLLRKEEDMEVMPTKNIEIQLL